MIKLFIFFLFIACAQTPGRLLPGGQITEKDFSSSKEAENYLKNHWNYIALLFEQSYDPYYGNPKWTEECLKRNKHGEIKEEQGHSFFISQLLLNDKKEPGYCYGKLTEMIYLHCQNSPKVFRILCDPGQCEKAIPFAVCSVKN